MILTDPVWGININLSGKFDNQETHFDDSSLNFSSLVLDCVKQFYRILKKDSHSYIFCALEKFNFWKEALEEVGFHVRPQPLIWIKEGGGFTNFDMNFMPTYETIVFAQKGARPLKEPTSDVFNFSRAPKEERLVNTQKPVLLLKKFISLSSDKGDLVLDPFAGSGSTIAASILMQRIGVGIELNEDVANIARFICQKTEKGL